MTVVVVTGSCGLIGSEAALHFGSLGLEVVGIDNDMRRVFFGEDGSTEWNRSRLQERLGKRYTHSEDDVRDRGCDARPLRSLRARDRARRAHGRATLARLGRARAVRRLRHQRRRDAQPPRGDPAARSRGDVHLHLDEQGLRRPSERASARRAGDALGDRRGPRRTRTGSARTCRSTARLHSLFGASKVAADVLVQEYGRYFGLRTACFRGGTLTGPNHSAAELHGFLAYVMRCVMTGRAVQRVRLQGQAGPGRDPQRRPDPRVRRVLPGAARGRGLQHRRRAVQQRFRPRGDRRSARRSPARSSSGRTRRRTGSATTSGGSATTVASRAHYPELAARVRRAADPAGDPRRERGALAAGEGPAAGSRVRLVGVVSGDVARLPLSTTSSTKAVVVRERDVGQEHSLRVPSPARAELGGRGGIRSDREDRVAQPLGVVRRDDESGARRLDLARGLAVRRGGGDDGTTRRRSTTSASTEATCRSPRHAGSRAGRRPPAITASQRPGPCSSMKCDVRRARDRARAARAARRSLPSPASDDSDVVAAEERGRVEQVVEALLAAEVAAVQADELVVAPSRVAASSRRPISLGLHATRPVAQPVDLLRWHAAALEVRAEAFRDHADGRGSPRRARAPPRRRRSPLGRRRGRRSAAAACPIRSWNTSAYGAR